MSVLVASSKCLTLAPFSIESERKRIFSLFDVGSRPISWEGGARDGGTEEVGGGTGDLDGREVGVATDVLAGLGD